MRGSGGRCKHPQVVTAWHTTASLSHDTYFTPLQKLRAPIMAALSSKYIKKYISLHTAILPLYTTSFQVYEHCLNAPRRLLPFNRRPFFGKLGFRAGHILSVRPCLKSRCRQQDPQLPKSWQIFIRQPANPISEGRQRIEDRVFKALRPCFPSGKRILHQAVNSGQHFPNLPTNQRRSACRDFLRSPGIHCTPQGSASLGSCLMSRASRT